MLSAGVLLLKAHRVAEEIDAEQRRFAALPGEIDLVAWLSLDILPDIGIENLIAHGPIAFGGIELFLFEIEAVFAIEVADGPDGLGEDVKRTGNLV